MPASHPEKVLLVKIQQGERRKCSLLGYSRKVCPDQPGTVRRTFTLANKLTLTSIEPGRASISGGFKTNYSVTSFLQCKVFRRKLKRTSVFLDISCMTLAWSMRNWMSHLNI